MSFFDLLFWWASPVGAAMWLAAATGIAVWLRATGAGLRWAVRRALGRPAEPSLQQQLDAALDEAETWRAHAAAVPEPEQRARHLAAAWRLSDNTATEASGWELDAVLDGSLSVRAVAGQEVPCTGQPCVVCGTETGQDGPGPDAEDKPDAEPDDGAADPETLALRTVSTGRCPTCDGDMETCRCGTTKPGIPRTAGSAV